ncbi:MAG TPA: purine-nucleoside phosphorylase [Gemmataceae bacterium]|nr:purine-nucleoside phosphorylase [Gemmataceae bacterium]
MNDVLTFKDLTSAAKILQPAVAIVLGSGMGALAERRHTLCRLPFSELPGLSATSVVGHKGCLTIEDWSGKHVIFFGGRLHGYEGHPWRTVVGPVDLAHSLGVRVLLLANAAGGIHPGLHKGSLMAVRDHIEWTRPYCWRLPGPGGLGGPRPTPYSARLLQVLEQAASAQALELHNGIYAAVTGPCYETPAEIRALTRWGADAVGMSTAREAQRAYDLGIECAAVSCITNRAAGLDGEHIHHEKVLAAAAAQGERLTKLVEGFLAKL